MPQVGKWSAALTISLPRASFVEDTFPRANGDRQPILWRGERTDPARIVGARRVIGVVEVEQHPPASIAMLARIVEPQQFAALDRVVEIAPGAVGLAAAGGIAERQEKPTAVDIDPVDCECNGIP